MVAGTMILVGDNPFHGISHLSQDRARTRVNKIATAEYAAELVMSSKENGANGFMFSVSGATLDILKSMKTRVENQQFTLHAIVPYAYEYVRLATHLGTVGLARKIGGRILLSTNLRGMVTGFKGVAGMNIDDLMKTYLDYEISRIKSAISKRRELTTVLLHEVATDMIIALDADWLARSYIRFLSQRDIKPGFETRNFAYLVKKFEKWNIDFSEIELVSSFNKIGFQMNPSKLDCEKALNQIPECDVIAMSILAAGYLGLPEAVEYIKTLPNLKGVVVGVSKEEHASETFSLLREKFTGSRP
jgi:hypothetical protein